MTKLEARITWNTEAAGCIESPFSGIQPSFWVAGDLIASRVESRDGTKTMERGRSYDVLISLPYGENYEPHLRPGMEVRLQVGGRVIAVGSVSRVMEP
jgi:hypothetical protein